jgi:rod shape determining protein RodA
MWLLSVVVLIASIGVINLYSATSAYVGASQRAGLADIYVTQIYWFVVGFLLAMLIAAIDYRHLERLAPVLYGGGLLVLLLVFVLATDVRGSSRWLRLGSFTFQPSEFMKPLVVLMVARYIHGDHRTEARGLFDLFVPFFIALVPTAMVMLQPDLGTSLIYLLTTASMLAITRIRGATLLSGVGLAGAAGYLMWQFGLRDYQRSRITSFLDPEKDEAGSAWHALQSQTAIGNGGLTGEGFMQGTQNQFGFLPDQHSDFPFSVFAEEFGFLGCLLLLSLYCFLAIWTVHIASQAKDRFGAALAVGCGAIIFWHTVFNLGMSMGLLPVVGITLPLFSYGGSSLVTMLISLGMLMNVSMRS